MSRVRHRVALAGAAALLGLSRARAEADTAAFSIASGGRISTLTRSTFVRSAANQQQLIRPAFGGRVVGRLVR